MSHYQWLEKNLPEFFEKKGINPNYANGVISAHGDKCYGAKAKFEKAGLHFFHGVAIYLLGSFEPFSSEVRQTENGWVDPFDWVIENKDRFLVNLPSVE